MFCMKFKLLNCGGNKFVTELFKRLFMPVETLGG